ncbi:thioredoxin-domain-containing protein [Backusella circina FSU 941]|nr:thioredoxin-domain-containing protein [Backusella circina FSU 941]
MIKLTAIVAMCVSAFVVNAINEGELKPEQIDHHNNGPLFVEYYMSDCKACENLEPTWKKVSEEYSSAFGKLDCGKYIEYCKQRGVDKYPTIIAKVNGNTWNEFTDGYDSLESVEQFVKDNQPFGFNFPEGKNMPLENADQFKHIRESKAPWFVKFYAPWCGHCKHLAPIWDKLAKKLEGKVRFGEVNCDEHRDLCSEYKVTGLPTLKYFVHGVNLDYAGSRTIEKLEDYATRMSGSPVRAIHDKSLDNILDESDSSFVYVYGTKDSESALLETIAPRFMEELPFYKTNDPKTVLRFNLADSELPAFVIAKDGDFVKYKGPLSEIESWIEREKKPLVIRASSLNLNHIIRNHEDHRYAVLGIAKLKEKEPVENLREIARRNEREGVLFALMDGEVWGSYVARLYGLTSGFMPAAVIIDTKERVHYTKDALGKNLKLRKIETVLETLKIVDTLEGVPTVPPKNMDTIEKLAMFVGNHWILVSIGLFVVFGGLFMLMTGSYPPFVKKEKLDNKKKEE